jgi:(E)-4-hydroxy-3-methylbut-2-enyl-diphosphate synthase
MISRKVTKEIRIGNVLIGSSNKIAIQSMCNTKTKDTSSTIEQIKSLEKEGCNIVRVAVLDIEDALALKTIKANINIPLVADIHFDYRLALTSIEAGIDKLRINPGNIGSIDKIRLVVDKCKEKNIPIRIGVNMGSLDKDIEKEYGRCAKALVYSAKKHVEILENLEFYDIVISMKASDVETTIEAYKLASDEFEYPLHIGVTEAGTSFSGSIKSSIGLGTLLYLGIGDTIRVSLSDDPVKEISVAKEILSTFNYYNKPTLTSCPTCGRTQYNMLPILYEIEEFLKQFDNCNIKVAVMGCAVNGPGEAKDADIGIAGGKNEVLLFKNGEIIRKIDEKNALEEFKKEIKLLIDQKNK